MDPQELQTIVLETLSRHRLEPLEVRPGPDRITVILSSPAEASRAEGLIRALEASLRARDGLDLRWEVRAAPRPASPPPDPFAALAPHSGAAEAIRAVRSFAAAGPRAWGRLLLLGPAGTGKTRLLSAAADALRSAGATPIRLFGPAHPQPPPGAIILWDEAPEDLKERLGPAFDQAQAILAARRGPAQTLVNAGFELYFLDPVPPEETWPFFRELLRLRGISVPEHPALILADDLPARLAALADRILRLRGPGPATAEEIRRLQPQLRTAPISPEAVERAFAQTLGADLRQLRGPGRDAPTVRLRALLALLLREEAGLSYQAVGRRLGGRDHTTIMYLVEKAQRLAEDPETARILRQVRRKLKEGV